MMKSLLLLIPVLGTIAMGVYLMMSYAHGTFMTIREKADIIERLDRIEKKIDRINYNGKK